MSVLGQEQAQELGSRYKNIEVDLVFCSDLKRSYQTAKLAFKGRSIPIICDKRLREINYGSYTGFPKEKMDQIKPRFIKTPFPGGQSYSETSENIRLFLNELLKKYDNKKILIIGHRATQYGLEYWLNRVSLSRSINRPFRWQPGWQYQLKKILPKT